MPVSDSVKRALGVVFMFQVLQIFMYIVCFAVEWLSVRMLLFIVAHQIVGLTLYFNVVDLCIHDGDAIVEDVTPAGDDGVLV